MNIVTVIEYLNKTYGYNLNGSYYKSIGEWNDWWKGKYKPFHVYHEKRSGRCIRFAWPKRYAKTGRPCF